MRMKKDKFKLMLMFTCWSWLSTDQGAIKLEHWSVFGSGGREQEMREALLKYFLQFCINKNIAQIYTTVKETLLECWGGRGYSFYANLANLKTFPVQRTPLEIR